MYITNWNIKLYSLLFSFTSVRFKGDKNTRIKWQ